MVGITFFVYLYREIEDPRASKRPIDNFFAKRCTERIEGKQRSASEVAYG